MREESFFSIVVPTYNREAQLARCLNSLAHLDYPRNRFEIIVVNDGGAQPGATTSSLGRDLDVKLIHQKHAGSAAARNTGAATPGASSWPSPTTTVHQIPVG